jgi:hypothetical protein
LPLAFFECHEEGRRCSFDWRRFPPRASLNFLVS